MIAGAKELTEDCSGSVGLLTCAFTTPLLKGSTLDSELINNFRPFPIYSSYSKLIERAVFELLSNHLNTNNYNVSCQYPMDEKRAQLRSFVTKTA